MTFNTSLSRQQPRECEREGLYRAGPGTEQLKGGCPWVLKVLLAD